MTTTTTPETLTRENVKAMFDLPPAIIWLIDKATHAYSVDETPDASENCPPYFGECWQFHGNLPYRMRQEVQKFLESRRGSYGKQLVTNEELTISLVYDGPKTVKSNRCFFGIDTLQTGTR